MDFYEKKRRTGVDLAAWLGNDDRVPFDEFARNVFLSYGFDKDNLLRVMAKMYGLTVDEHGELVKVK